MRKSLFLAVSLLALGICHAAAGEPIGMEGWSDRAQCAAAAAKIAEALGATTEAVGNSIEIVVPEQDVEVQAFCSGSRVGVSSDAKTTPALLKRVGQIAGILSGGDPASATAGSRCVASMKPEKNKIGKIGRAHAREAARHPTYTYWGDAKIGPVGLRCFAEPESRHVVSFTFGSDD